MSPLETLRHYFPTGTAEGEGAILQNAFIYPDQLTDVVNFPPGNPCILVGSKGVGKTAIIQQLLTSFRKQNIPALSLTPDDMIINYSGSTGDLASLKRLLYDELKQAVAVELGKLVKRGLIGLNDARLVEIAQEKGERSSDWVQQLLIILSSIAKDKIKFDAKQLTADLAASAKNSSLIGSIATYLESNSSPFWLLIDDTDQVASPNESSHLNRIWAFLLAVRKLAMEAKNVKCIVSLRTEVWLRLQRDDKGQRDQIDHIRPLVVELRAPEPHLQQILDKRFSLAAQESGQFPHDPMLEFFEHANLTLPGSKEQRRWNTFILKNSRERPRDIVQLVNKLIATSMSNSHVVIKSEDAMDAMHPYSKERAEDLAVEVGNYCEQFLDIIRTFAEVEFELSFEALRTHLKTIPSRFPIKIGMKTVRPDDDNGMLLILALLHESGFLNPRVTDTKRAKQFRHVMFVDDKFFVTRSRWNDMQSARWEVHPVFRTYLIDIKDELGIRRRRKK